jgi:hexosaminidase
MLRGLLVALWLTQLCLALWPQSIDLQLDSTTQVAWLDHAIHGSLHCENEQSGESEHVLHANYLGGTIGEIVRTARRAQQLLLDKLHDLSRGDGSPRSEPELSESTILEHALSNTVKSITTSRFVPWKLFPRHSAFEPASDAVKTLIEGIDIRQRQCPAVTVLQPTSFFGGDESYKLVIQNGAIFVTTNNTIGTLRALQTLQQLFFTHSSSSRAYTPFASVNITDGPAWRHRGISLDIARNPFTVEDVLRTIDTMSTVKLNKLHIHATDSQSWPLEIPSLPDLARKGAYRPDLVFTAEDLRRVQLHGAMNGVSVFVELDMPGHTASVAHAYPDLIAAFNELDWSTFAAEPLSGQLKLNSSKVDAFVATVLNDLLPRMRSYTSLYHIGGDEVNRVSAQNLYGVALCQRCPGATTANLSMASTP